MCMHECTCICVYVMSVCGRVYMCMHECTCIYVYA